MFKTIVASLVLALCLSFAACGGGGGGDAQPLDEYLADMNDLLGDLVQARLEAQEEHLDPIAQNADLQTQVKAARGFLTDFRDSVGGFSQDLGELRPPDDVQESHEELVAATGDFVQTLNMLLRRLDNVENFEDLDRVLDRFFPAAGVLATACYAVEDTVVESGRKAALNCGLETPEQQQAQ